MAKKKPDVQIVPSPGWFLIKSPRDIPEAATFTESIKELPFPDRRWCRRIEAWAVRRIHERHITDAIAKCFGVKLKLS
jgi:hypothetical protein